MCKNLNAIGVCKKGKCGARCHLLAKAEPARGSSRVRPVEAIWLQAKKRAWARCGRGPDQRRRHHECAAEDAAIRCTTADAAGLRPARRTPSGWACTCPSVPNPHTRSAPRRALSTPSALAWCSIGLWGQQCNSNAPVMLAVCSFKTPAMLAVCGAQCSGELSTHHWCLAPGSTCSDFHQTPH